MNTLVKIFVISLVMVTYYHKSNAFFGLDKNDYTSVVKSFQNKLPPLFKYESNKFCRDAKLYMIPYTKVNTGATSMVGQSGKLKAHFFALSFGHAIASYLEGEIYSDLALSLIHI